VQMMICRGVRGATTIEEDTEQAIFAAVGELLEKMIGNNGIKEEDVASVIFTTTSDLKSTYPARVARELGWTRTALLDCQEMSVPGELAMCVRALLHWNTAKSIDEIEHIYLRGAKTLRPDFAKPSSATPNGDRA